MAEKLRKGRPFAPLQRRMVACKRLGKSADTSVALRSSTWRSILCGSVIPSYDDCPEYSAQSPSTFQKPARRSSASLFSTLVAIAVLKGAPCEIPLTRRYRSVSHSRNTWQANFSLCPEGAAAPIATSAMSQWDGRVAVELPYLAAGHYVVHVCLDRIDTPPVRCLPLFLCQEVRVAYAQIEPLPATHSKAKLARVTAQRIAALRIANNANIDTRFAKHLSIDPNTLYAGLDLDRMRLATVPMSQAVVVVEPTPALAIAVEAASDAASALTGTPAVPTSNEQATATPYASIDPRYLQHHLQLQAAKAAAARPVDNKVIEVRSPSLPLRCRCGNASHRWKATMRSPSA